MNRFVKNNILLIVSVGVACLAALGLLIYGVIEWVQISELSEKTEQLVKKIETLNRKTPVPVDENRKPITENTKYFSSLREELEKSFTAPLRPARDAFINELKGLKGENTEEKINNFIEDYNSTVRSNDTLAGQSMAWEALRLKYPNWNAAVEKFRQVAAASGVTSEEFGSFNTEAALEEVGISRHEKLSLDNFKQFFLNIRRNFREIIGEKLAGTDNFGLLSNPDSYPKGEYSILAAQSFIISDILRRISNSKVENLTGFLIRGATPDSIANVFGEENGCRVCHYTFEVNGSLDAIRELAANFDKRGNGFSKRFYIIRSVFLYSPDAECAAISQLAVPKVVIENENAEQPAESNSGIFGSGRRGRLARERHEAEQKEKEAKAAAEKQAEEERVRREKNLEPHQRQGYGDVKLGDVSSFRAVFDIDYIERR